MGARTNFPAQVCSSAGCTKLSHDGTGRCPAHPRELFRRMVSTQPSPRTITGWELTKARRALFANDPLCVACAEQGRVSLATIRDHIIPLQEGGADEASNTQGLCRSCHAIKSEQERRRGLGEAPISFEEDRTRAVFCGES